MSLDRAESNQSINQSISQSRSVNQNQSVIISQSINYQNQSIYDVVCYEQSFP